ncbi:hypothetical protein O9929_21875 [Vibrio lentus]|nr:hypothetical protein [Vibrio lentus]
MEQPYKGERDETSHRYHPDVEINVTFRAAAKVEVIASYLSHHCDTAWQYIIKGSAIYAASLIRHLALVVFLVRSTMRLSLF